MEYMIPQDVINEFNESLSYSEKYGNHTLEEEDVYNLLSYFAKNDNTDVIRTYITTGLFPEEFIQDVLDKPLTDDDWSRVFG